MGQSKLTSVNFHEISKARNMKDTAMQVHVNNIIACKAHQTLYSCCVLLIMLPSYCVLHA